MPLPVRDDTWYTCCARALDMRCLETVGLTTLRVLSVLSLLKATED